MSATGAQVATAPVPLDELMAIAHLHEQAGRLDDAARVLGYVLAAAPRHADARHMLGILAYHAGRIEEAASHMEAAIADGLDTPLYYRNICELYRLLGRHDEAAETAQRAVLLNPGDPDALANFGIVMADQLQLDAAAEAFRAALALDPHRAAAHLGLAEVLLQRGQFTEGWEEYDWRFRMPGVPQPIPNTDVPEWDGRPLPAGTLLLIADQGFGDGVQFGRYIAWARQRCPDIAVACGPELRPLMAQMAPGARLISDWQQAGAYAAWRPLTGLPRLAGTTLATIPASIPYLRAEPERAARWRARLDGLIAPGLRRVGVVWAGRPAHRQDRKRSMRLADLAPVAARSGVALVVLQKGPAAAQAGGYFGRAPLLHLSAELADFQDTMAVMANLDVVLSVDTSVAHLAGAMGLPTWIMLPWVAEWRWLLDRADSPWYPTARLFRQPAYGRWDVVAAHVADALAG